MMNIFIMILVVLFMAGYYMMDSPSQRVQQQETEYAVNRSDLRAVAECATAVHNAQIRGGEFNDICVEQYEIQSEFVCLNANLTVTKCNIVRNKKPAYSFIVTATGILPEEAYNATMEILEEYYSDAGTFGIFEDKVIVSGGTSSKRVVPKGIISAMDLTDGQLVYMTQYEIPDTETEFAAPVSSDIICPAGTVKTYRFGRWQCVGYNTKTSCGGDMIWDSDLLDCVPDESRKPLCAAQQTAVMVDDVWECVNPFPEKVCPDQMVARLNYTTLEWECVSDPTTTPDVKKCANVTHGAIYGAIGATLRVPPVSCTDCERMVTDENTCATACIPDPAKVNDPACYPGGASQCRGANRALYFGFPSRTYVSHVDAVQNRAVPLDKMHSQNRKFNCLDCGERGIDESRSFPPYIAICNQ